MRTLLKYFTLLLFCFGSNSTLAAYFQQDVKYTIHVTLDDKKNSLVGDEVITYKNNSPVTLNVIYLHLWPAAYSGANTNLAKEFYNAGDARLIAAPEKDLGNIHSLDFLIDGEKAAWKKLQDTADICVLQLKNPLKPGDSIKISTPFRVKIPVSYFSRLGHEDQAYFITQWYPKPAVYDESGWNYFSYLDQGEYYGEFGTFDVYITLPENYILGATGTRVDAENEIAFLNKQDSITRTINIFPDNEKTPESSATMKTVHFTQDKVHDFAWFADKRWHVLKDTVTLTTNGKKIITWSFFNNKEAEFWKQAPTYLRDALNYFSKWVGDYPYDEVTAVDVGDAPGGGMEYPMITAIGNYGSAFELEQTIFHEVGHNWFYGILGNNERCHPLLDEGMNTYYETRYVYTKYENDSLMQIDASPFPKYYKYREGKVINHRMKKQYRYLGTARLNLDQSPDLCSQLYSSLNYRGDVYSKSTLTFDYLNYYLGDSIFDLCIHEYFNKWKFKHPQPKDLREVFEGRTQKNLSWVFNDLLSTTKKLDYSIKSARITGENVSLKIANKGTINGPIPVNQMKNGKTISTFWLEGFSGKKDTTINCSMCDEIRIDADRRMPELYSNNNNIRLKGSFRKIEKPELKLGTRLEESMKTQIFFFPVLGWNNYDKFMPGILFHNISFHEKKIEYSIMPMFSTGTKGLSGGGDINYHFYPAHSRIYRITLCTGISRYAYLHDSYSNPTFEYSNTNHFTKSDTRLILNLRQKNQQAQIKSTVTFRSIYIWEEIPYAYHYRKSTLKKLFGQIEFKKINTNDLERSMEKVTLTFNNEFFGAFAETSKFFMYDKPKKGFEARLFAGYIHPSDNAEIDYRMSLSGRTGDRDYLFDEVFLGRTESDGLLSQQFAGDYAGFRTPTSYFRLAQEWMTGLNVNTTLPGMIPFRIFASFGSFDNADNNGSFGKISWEAGVDLPVIKDIFVISFPVAYSDDIDYAIKSQDLKKGNLIRFELHLKNLNPLNMIKSFYDK